MSEKSKDSKAEAKLVLPEEKPECFVIMPISTPEGYADGHFTCVYQDIFSPACELAGYKAVRADDFHKTDLIHLSILEKLLAAPIALCDLSSRNPNVLFELGLRQAFDKPTVLVQEVSTARIFDIDIFRITPYSRELSYRNVREAQSNVSEAIVSTMQDSLSKKSVNSLVRLLKLASPAALGEGEAPDVAEMIRFLSQKIDALQGDIYSIRERQNLRPSRAADQPSLTAAEVDDIERMIERLGTRLDAGVAARSDMQQLEKIRSAAKRLVIFSDEAQTRRLIAILESVDRLARRVVALTSPLTLPD